MTAARATKSIICHRLWFVGAAIPASHPTRTTFSACFTRSWLAASIPIRQRIPKRQPFYIVKNARGHAYHEIGEPLLEAPDHVAFVPLAQLSAGQRDAFETVGTAAEFAVWPEVGSRMTVQLLDREAMVGGWITVEPGRYRYSIDWSEAVTVKTVIWEYLATETRWER